MPPEEREENTHTEAGTYIVLDGKTRNLLHHPSDFSVKGKRSEVRKQIPGAFKADVQPLALGISRVIADTERRDQVMAEVRKDKQSVAHHIYEMEDTGEEIVITDRLFLTLEKESSEQIKTIVDEYRLDRVGQRDNVYTLKVTAASGRNPLKIANELTNRKGVVSCVPEILFSIKLGNAPMPIQPALFKYQWHLSTDLVKDQPLNPSAGMNVTKAWEIAGGKGESEIVIAVIDDGFDLVNREESIQPHDAFKKSIIDEVHMKNLGEGSPNDVTPKGKDFHGTSVASLIFADGDAMLGVAPGCTFLPIRIGSISNIEPGNLIKILEDISGVADVVNCSFSMSPQSLDLINTSPDFIPRMACLVKNGGRRGNGLIIVFAAGNDDAPISMSAEVNQSGITFVQNLGISEKIVQIKNLPVHCGYGEIPGVVVVGATTSIKRKADYSNWGEQITVVASSDNFHELTMLQLRETVADHRSHFPELGIVAALNRLSGDRPLLARPILEDSLTLTTFESFYTKEFGGTSAAAALVSGVIGLMLSVNPNLSPKEVIKILQETAENQMDAKLSDLGDDDLNLKDIQGDKHKLFFGAGKVDAATAVQAAKDRLAVPPPTPSISPVAPPPAGGNS